jgi:hypothetical protein
MTGARRKFGRNGGRDRRQTNQRRSRGWGLCNTSGASANRVLWPRLAASTLSSRRLIRQFVARNRPPDHVSSPGNCNGISIKLDRVRTLINRCANSRSSFDWNAAEFATAWPVSLLGLAASDHHCSIPKIRYPECAAMERHLVEILAMAS